MKLGAVLGLIAVQSAVAQQDRLGALPYIHVQGNVYALVGPGGNTTVQVGNSGVLVVDTQTAAVSDELLATIRKLSDKPVRYILNTSGDADHTGGNGGLAKVFGSATAVMVANTPGASATQTVKIVAHENVLNRMSAGGIPTITWPTDTFLSRDKEVFFNSEAVQMMHAPAAHTDGDSIIYFRRSDVISTGDLFLTNGYPVIDLQRGGSLQGVIDGLNRILDIAIPAHHEEGGTYIIPGHGRVCDEFDVSEYRDMITIIRDRIQAMVKKAMTLEQVKASRPTRDYDGAYGPGDAFVEAAYRSLTKK
jgi:glyoxylase-like metal-dependent hydrolase (beta-lactamase superfamily II)